MAADTNSVVIVGRLTRAPELRAVGDTHVLSGRLAFARREKKAGEWVDVSGFVDVTLGWGNRATALEQWLDKGSRIGVTGSLRWREYEKDGERRQVLDVDARDVQLLDGKRDQDAPARGNGLPVDQPRGGGGPSASTGDDDDIPFAAWRW